MDEIQLQPGMKVRVAGDGDGSAGSIGTIKTVFKSGRCTVVFADGGFRNLPPKCLEVVE